MSGIQPPSGGPAPPAGGPAPPGHEHIVEHVDESGNKYFYDKKRRASAWNKDELLKAHGATWSPAEDAVQMTETNRPSTLQEMENPLTTGGGGGGGGSVPVAASKGGELRQPSGEYNASTQGEFGTRGVPIGGYVQSSPSPTTHKFRKHPRRRILTSCPPYAGD